jgi:transcription-repair coupling factor (superfamily II helicase)
MAILRQAADAASTFVYLAASERRAEEIGRALAGFAPEAEVLVLPPWDCLPYDRASPSAELMGRRMRVLGRLARRADGPRWLVTSPDAAVQRLPPPPGEHAFLALGRARRLDRDEIASFAALAGYRAVDRVDEPGEIVLQGEVVDIFPADAERPLRIVLGEDGAVTDIRTFDPITQRSVDEIERASVGPASELVLDMGSEIERRPGLEHHLPELCGGMTTLFDVVGAARLARDAGARDRLRLVAQQIREAFEAQRTFGERKEKPLMPDRLYLGAAECEGRLADWRQVSLDFDGLEALPGPSDRRNPSRAFCDQILRHQQEGRRVLLAGIETELRAMARALRRGCAVTPHPIPSLAACLSRDEPGLFSIVADIGSGFVDRANRLVVISASDVFGARLVERRFASAVLTAETDLQIGDVVIHEEHGVGLLRGLERVEIGGVEQDFVRLDYHGDTSVLVPMGEIGLIWRYGAEPGAVALDRLKGESWRKRRAEAGAEIGKVARRLVGLARERAGAAVAPIEPPRQAYADFAARFAYPETPDQAAAIEAVLADLGSGRRMDRLVCGDVGFGKTEVALRAAAAVALGGRQVAVVAPTTVLARQHLETFRRRFAGTGLAVAGLSRLETSQEVKEVRGALVSGELRIVVGTNALASKSTEFADLGLMIIDEEQKFGAAAKESLRRMADRGHLLTLTATPIPRTLLSAKIGLQDVSLLASPPARRRPIRTFLVPFDAAAVRTALLREKRRGGQSFFVVPRIEDIGPMGGRLAELAPELAIRVAHGDLPVDEADEVMVRFADGDGDVLLATNIIESGLDVPRANTMMVWRPDRFGLAQLHQLRGRVGRGRAQGFAYMLSDPEGELAEEARARLSALEAFDRLGSGLALSARDLDLRGGGDLLSEQQAGHVKLIGQALYQRLLARAVAAARGEAVEPDWAPVLNLGMEGAIPPDHVPDAVARLNLYARLARLETVGEIDDFEEEIEDRFGAPPDEVSTLFAFARLRCLARAAGVRQVDAGPKAIAVTMASKGTRALVKRLKERWPAAGAKEGRIIVPPAAAPQERRLDLVERLLQDLAAEAR